jgi:DNA topoisomerase-1
MEAPLTYVSDDEPGIVRVKTRARPWSIAGRTGRALGARSRDKRRIDALAIPPALDGRVDLHACQRAHPGHRRDARGRKQYRYHESLAAPERDETKFERLLEFGRRLPARRAQIERDLRRADLPRREGAGRAPGACSRTDAPCAIGQRGVPAREQHLRPVDAARPPTPR